ncbi:MAG: vitamin K epoxide reductase family protein [Patescibacteria group bacterium]
MTKSLKVAAIIFLVVSAIGFLDATYLTVEHYRGNIPPCTVAGCEIVLTSGQSKIAGVPVSLFGSLYYLTLLILAIAYLDRKNNSLIRLASYGTIIGFIMSAYFVYLQLFVLNAICQYCMISAGTSTVLFITGMFVLSRRQQEKETGQIDVDNLSTD